MSDYVGDVNDVKDKFKDGTITLQQEAERKAKDTGITTSVQ